MPPVIAPGENAPVTSAAGMVAEYDGTPAVNLAYPLPDELVKTPPAVYTAIALLVPPETSATGISAL